MSKAQADNACMSTFLSTKELAILINVPEGTLRQWRCIGVGPVWYKIEGKVKYHVKDVEEYLHKSKRIPSVRANTEERLVSISRSR